MKKSKPTTCHDLFIFSEITIQDLIDDGRYGTSQSYTKAVSSFRTFLEETDLLEGDGKRFPIENMDDMLIYKYNRFLNSRGIIRNSISFYNRTLRAIYNKAVRRYRIPNRNPFADVYTGIDKTWSRAVSENAIAKLLSLELSADKSLEITRDLFIFSYVMRGISFVDMAYLTRSDIHDSYIIYSRKKTGCRMAVKIEPQIREMLQKYSRIDSEFLLPILQDAAEQNCFFSADEHELYRHYQAKLAVYNRSLKILARMIGEHTSLTSYVSRHSWATAARNTNVSLSVISEGLGHSSERTTRIYLGAFDGELIDKANRQLMERIRKVAGKKE